MDVMRTGCSVLGCCLEKDDHAEARGTNIIDRLVPASVPDAVVLTIFAVNGKRIDVETDDDTVEWTHPASAAWREAAQSPGCDTMHTSLILYARHDSTLDLHRARVVAGTNSGYAFAITRGDKARSVVPSTAVPTKRRSIQSRYDNPDQAEADIRERVGRKEIVIGWPPGLHHR